MAIFATHNLADARRIQLLLAHGGVAAITAFIEEPQEFAEALETMASDFGFRESYMIDVFTRGNTLALQTLIKNQEKIATAMAIFATHNLADARRVQLLLARGGVAAITAFIEEPQEFAEALETLASDNGFTESSMTLLLTHGSALTVQTLIESPEKIATATITMVAHGFRQSSMCALLTYGCQLAVQAFTNSPQNIVSALALFRDSKSVNSVMIAERLLHVMTHGRVSVVTVLMENQPQLSHSISVLLHNNITDPMVVFLILERGDNSVIDLMIHYPQTLADIILSSVGTPHQMTVELLISIQVTLMGQPIHTPAQ